MTPYFCESRCPKIHNCGFMSKDNEIKKIVNKTFKQIKKCPCSECIVIMKCGTSTGINEICNKRYSIFRKIEYELSISSRKKIEPTIRKLRKKKNDTLYKRFTPLE